MKTIDITNKTKMPPMPISYIYGKEMIEKVGIVKPEQGMVVYLIHESEVGDWMPDFSETAAYCVPSGNSFHSFIKAFDLILENNLPETTSFKIVKLRKK